MVRSYSPGCNPVTSYRPWSLVKALRCAPVLTEVNSTTAPTTLWDCWSAMLPLRAARLLWAVPSWENNTRETTRIRLARKFPPQNGPTKFVRPYDRRRARLGSDLTQVDGKSSWGRGRDQ